MKKGLVFVSILMVLLGGFTLATGLVDIGLLSSTGSDGIEVKALMGLAFILFVLSGLLDIIGGLLGLRAAKNPAKAGGAILFGLLALAASAGSAALEPSVQNICACVVPLIYFVCAIGVKASRS